MADTPPTKATADKANNIPTTQNTKNNAAAKGFLFTVSVRLLSFILTQLTNRLVNPHTLGSAALKLDLWCSTTVLFVGREGFRLALLRIADDNDDDDDNDNGITDAGGGFTTGRNKRQSRRNKTLVNNVAWLVVPTGLFLTFVSLILHLSTYVSTNPGLTSSELYDYKMGGILYCLATAVEILTEPYTICCLRTLDVTTRARAEAAAGVGKTLSLVSLLWCLERENSPLPAVVRVLPGPVSAFGVAQIVYALVAFGVFYGRKHRKVEPPRWYLENGGKKMEGKDDEGGNRSTGGPTSNPYRDPSSISKTSTFSALNSLTHCFDGPTLRLSFLFTLQSVLKHILTEGDRIVLSALVGSYDAGVYAMASSYGGIASRLLLQPLEENARLLFSNLHAHSTSSVQEGLSSESSPSSTSTFSSTSNTNTVTNAIVVGDLERTYHLLLKLVVYLGLLFLSFGPNYSSVLLRLLAGRKWGDDPSASVVLSAFCVYTAFTALNGTSEAFVYGVAEGDAEIWNLSVAHAVVGAVFYAMAPVMVRHGSGDGGGGVGGTLGLIAANGVCMALRSVYSLWFAMGYFGRRRGQEGKKMTAVRMFGRLGKILPRLPVLLAFGVSYWITRWSRLTVLREAVLGNESDGRALSSLPPPVLSIETALHVGVGVGCLFLTGGIVYACEGDYIRSLRLMFQARRRRRIDDGIGGVEDRGGKSKTN